MRSDPIDVSLVVACYQEAGHLEHSIAEVIGVLDCTKWSYEIVFVEDCSTDNTAEIVGKLVEKHGRPDRPVRAIYHETNKGRGRTVADGIREAAGQVVGFLDIDLEVHARYLPDMVRAVNDGADVAIAERIYKIQFTQFHRHVLSRGYALMVRCMVSAPVRDTEAGYKFFKRERIMPVLDETESEGWFWDTEIMVLAHRAGLAIAQIPCLFIRRKGRGSTVRILRDTIAYFRALCQFRKRLRDRSKGDL